MVPVTTIRVKKVLRLPIIRSFYKTFTENSKAPGKEDVKKFGEAHPVMKSIEWDRIKYHVYNT